MAAVYFVLVFYIFSLVTASDPLKTKSDATDFSSAKSGGSEYASINYTLFGKGATNKTKVEAVKPNTSAKNGELDEDLARLHERLNGMISKKLEKAMVKMARVTGSSSQRKHILRLAQATLEIKHQWGAVAEWLDTMSSDRKWRGRFLAALTRDVLSVVCNRVEHGTAENTF